MIKTVDKGHGVLNVSKALKGEEKPPLIEIPTLLELALPLFRVSGVVVPLAIAAAPIVYEEARKRGYL